MRHQALVYPVCDARVGATDSYARYAEGYFMTAADMRWFLDHYAAGVDPTDPRLSPLAAEDVTGAAPATIVLAECDPLRDEGVAYARKLEAAGVEVELREYPGPGAPVRAAGRHHRRRPRGARVGWRSGWARRYAPSSASAPSTSSSCSAGLTLGNTRATLPSGVDQHARALVAEVGAAVAVLLDPGAVLLGDLAALVGQQREREPVLVGELAQVLDRVGRDAQHDRVGGLVVGRVVARAARLGGAPRGVRLGVEVDEPPLAVEVGQADVVAVLVVEREVGCGPAGVDHELLLRSSRRAAFSLRTSGRTSSSMSSCSKSRSQRSGVIIG